MPSDPPPPMWARDMSPDAPIPTTRMVLFVAIVAVLLGLLVAPRVTAQGGGPAAPSSTVPACAQHWPPTCKQHEAGR
jgi:hypothetical protein